MSKSAMLVHDELLLIYVYNRQKFGLEMRLCHTQHAQFLVSKIFFQNSKIANKRVSATHNIMLRGSMAQENWVRAFSMILLSPRSSN